MDKQPAVYILVSARNGTLHGGVTSNLVTRVWQHRDHAVNGFTDKYRIIRLVWYEMHGTMESAILREKRIKKWRRSWKIEVIEERNPYWNDLWDEITGQSKDAGSPRSRG